MARSDCYPWTEAAFDAFFSSKDRQAHAYLLAGQSGLGKTVLAEQLAKAMLCQQQVDDACGECHSCRLLESGNHPDLHVLQSEKRTVEVNDLFAIYAPRYLEDESKRKRRKKPSAIIAIDQVRGVIPDINTRPHLSACRIIVLNAAEDLNINAANSLLKSLEEPPSDCFFLLISHEPGRLLPTLRSRCNRIDFRTPDKAQTLEWLNKQLPGRTDTARLIDSAKGIPLRALALADGEINTDESRVFQAMHKLANRQTDPVTAAAELIKKSELIEILTLLQIMTSTIIRLKIAARNGSAVEKDENKALIDLGKRLNFKQLYTFLDDLSESKQLAGGPLDDTLALESGLISWQRMFSK
ncbi:MAG: DNA polymerase III subunit delta' [Gammaproteobacteria bacterium]|nr:DNA polymerase III subunit delta' [Gammaproteobacteria bacterium]